MSSFSAQPLLKKKGQRSKALWEDRKIKEKQEMPVISPALWIGSVSFWSVLLAD